MTLTDQAYKGILDMIESGELAMGDKLSIRRMATALHVGYMPVQDAFKRLAAEGWVVIIGPQFSTRGTYVARTHKV